MIRLQIAIDGRSNLQNCLYDLVCGLWFGFGFGLFESILLLVGLWFDLGP